MTTTGDKAMHGLQGLIEMTQAEDTQEAFFALYTDSEVMAAHLASYPNAAEKIRRAQHCLRVARDPRSRFGVEASVPEVVAVCEAFLQAVLSSDEVFEVQRTVLQGRADGYQWDEVWSIVDAKHPGAGFGRGDSRLLPCSEWFAVEGS